VRRAASAIAAVCVLCASRVALAQDPTNPPTTTTPPNIGGANALDQAQQKPYWSGGQRRAFISSTQEIGLLYVRPQLAVGLGRPHYTWIGLESQTRLDASGGAQYGGLHAASPIADLRLGARYTFPANQRLLRPQASFEPDDLDIDTEPHSRYVALEAEATGVWPVVDRFSIFALGSAWRYLGIPQGYWFFEEGLHVVVAPPWVWRARAGPLVTFGKTGGFQIGAAGEVIGIPARDAVIVRVGPQMTVALTHHLDSTVSAMIVASSPDNIGLDGYEVGQFGLRYRWATGDQFPEFP